jgi:hypothetical protein
MDRWHTSEPSGLIYKLQKCWGPHKISGHTCAKWKSEWVKIYTKVIFSPLFVAKTLPPFKFFFHWRNWRPALEHCFSGNGGWSDVVDVSMSSPLGVADWGWDKCFFCIKEARWVLKLHLKDQYLNTVLRLFRESWSDWSGCDPKQSRNKCFINLRRIPCTAGIKSLRSMWSSSDNSD